MMKAAKEFEVPASTRIFLFFPEIFDREILFNQPEYHFEYEKNDMGFTGLKTPCPWYKSNKHIVFSDKSSYMAGRHGTIADYRSMVPIYCHRISFEKKECSGDPNSKKELETVSTRLHPVAYIVTNVQSSADIPSSLGKNTPIC
jgi:hypothetical protein